MSKINLPKNILDKEKYLALPSLEKGEYMHNLLKEILELNPNGATVSEIDREIYFGHSAIWHHLEILASRAVCLKVERGNTDVYHFNKVISSLKKLDIRGKYYYHSFDLVENTYGKFVRIQLKYEGRTGAVVTHSGVMIDYDLFGSVMVSLNKIKKLLPK